VSHEEDVAALVEVAVRDYGQLDIMVNNAGEPGPVGSIATLDLDRFNRTVAVHVGGVLAGMKYAAQPMMAARSGSIINMASTTARLAGWSGIGYSAAKAAVVQATRAVAVELGEYDVRVNSISPGPILTGIFAKGAGLGDDAADRSAGDLGPAFVDALALWQPIRRAGRPDDVAEAARWLGSDASAFVTGIDLVVDGGISAGRPNAVSVAERATLAAAFRQLATREPA
jgi:NAD(P)-dependent dehydrogenase (short-subunit alcohol dehydrogenase family)